MIKPKEILDPNEVETSIFLCLINDLNKNWHEHGVTYIQ